MERGLIVRFQKKEELALNRQTEFEEYLAALHAEMLSSFVEEEDSFGCRISITGKGLRDLTLNYPHIFDITEQEEIDISIFNNRYKKMMML